MLIEFRVANFRSFCDAQTLSMAASALEDHQETHTFDSGLKGVGRFLKSSVVYGPNAAGKTNLIRALQFMQKRVVDSASTAPTTLYPYSPFKFSALMRNAPSEFQVTFVENGIRYEYGFEMGPERIQKEWLIAYVNPRGRELFVRNYNEEEQKYDWKFSSYLKGRRSVWSEVTGPNALFLSTAVQLNSEQLLPVFEWFKKRLVIIVGITTLNPTLTLKLLNEPDGKERLLPFLREADLGIADLDIEREPVPSGALVLHGWPILEHTPGNPTPNLVKVTLSHWGSDDSEKIGLDLAEESSGTQVLFRSAGAWLNVFENAEVLLFDEIDTNLHTILIRFLVNKFHSSDSNPKNAQLLFTTHNTSLLSQDLFRRDQIWFIDKERDGASKLYPLSDFHPRNDESLERRYLRGLYGAVPILDDPSL